jgi:protein TonB
MMQAQLLLPSTRGSRLVGAVAALIGTAVVLWSVIAMNRSTLRAASEAFGTATVIEVQKKEKPPSSQPPPPKPKPRRTPAKTAPAPSSLGAALPGLDFGLPQYENDDLSALTGGLLGDGGDVVMTDDAVDVPPRPVLQAPMIYPPRAKAQGITGYVILSVLISPTGTVEKVKVLEASPAGLFEETAEAGVRNWRFEPAQYKGAAVRVWARQKVRFDLG